MRRRARRAGADHRDDVVAADGPGQPAPAGAILRYKRLIGLSSVEFGLVASLGRRPPMSVARLAEAVGMDKGQISRAFACLVSRKLGSRAPNPRDSREALVRLTRSGLAAPRCHRRRRTRAQRAPPGGTERGGRRNPP